MQTFHRQLPSMGTNMDLVLPGTEPPLCDLLAKKIRMELDWIEQRLSVYRPDSDISVINRAGYQEPVQLDDEMLLVFKEVFTLYEETGGFFDITMKPVLDYYLEHGSAGFLPGRIAETAGMDRIHLEDNRIRFLKKGMQIDLGGYGKGYAVRKVLNILQSEEVESALISFGGSLVYGKGPHPYGDRWKVSVPLEDKGRAPVFYLKDEALSTSGNSLNNQKKFANSGHIVNPETLRIRKGTGLVSVQAEDPVRAEVFSTALFSAGKKRASDIAGRHPDLKIECYFSSSL
ncbi:MAG: FAD:protein FMN transferase [Bacteroidales bacterium]